MNIKLIQPDGWPELSDDEIQEQIQARRFLVGQMVGQLYPSILYGEIHRLKVKDWLRKKLEEFEKDPEFALECALLAFEEELAKRQVPMPAGLSELIDKHFWDLV
ncbi:MAG: hypothetical protein KAJ73_10140 [Zetaproteobacteria bacterium]|nr:hypothetical protein [Zetaproteobacteria bacterium]